MRKDEARILIVDDEAIVRESLASWLAEDGFTVATAAGGAAAIDRVRAEPWDVLLVDLKMPEVDGLAVLAATRAARPAASVIIMTAYATVETAVQAMKGGAYDYLVKPFEPEELSLMVSKLVAERGAAVEPADPGAASAPGLDRLPAAGGGAGAAPASLEEVERRHIALVLDGCGWSISQAAAALGIDGVTLCDKIKRHGLTRGGTT